MSTIGDRPTAFQFSHAQNFFQKSNYLNINVIRVIRCDLRPGMFFSGGYHLVIFLGFRFFDI